MLRRLWLPLVLIALLAPACASYEEAVSGVVQPGGGPSPSVPVPPDAAEQSTPPADPPDGDFPSSHKAFAEHFTDPLYVDQAEDFAPFGNDEGSDTLWVWTQRRSELTRCTTLRWMFEQDDEVSGIKISYQQVPR